MWPFLKIKATEQYFPVVQFVKLHKVILTFEPVDEFRPQVWPIKWMAGFVNPKEFYNEQSWKHVSFLPAESVSRGEWLQ